MLPQETVHFLSLKVFRHALDQELGKFYGRTGCFYNKALLEHGHSRWFPHWLGRLQHCSFRAAHVRQRPQGPRVLKQVLSGLSQKVCADLCGESIRNSGTVLYLVRYCTRARSAVGAALVFSKVLGLSRVGWWRFITVQGDTVNLASEGQSSQCFVKLCTVMGDYICCEKEMHLCNWHEGTQGTHISCTHHNCVNKTDIPSNPADLRFCNPEPEPLPLAQRFFIHSPRGGQEMFLDKRFHIVRDASSSTFSFRKIHCKLTY